MKLNAAKEAICDCGGHLLPVQGGHGRMVMDEWQHELRCETCSKSTWLVWNFPVAKTAAPAPEPTFVAEVNVETVADSPYRSSLSFRVF